jgi:thioredoxin-dependent peroxiredoxin
VAAHLRSTTPSGILPFFALQDQVPMRLPKSRLALVTMLCLASSVARAQQTATATPAYPAPEVGTLAPDFALPGATRYGTLRDSVRLSDFRGKTVVLAFFYRARTKG